MKFHWNVVSEEQFFVLFYVVDSKRHDCNLQVNWEEENEVFCTSPYWEKCQLSSMCAFQSQDRNSASS